MKIAALLLMFLLSACTPMAEHARREEKIRSQEQYNTDPTLREIREKDCRKTRKSIPRKDGTIEIVERTICS